jgi:hypothetical protein
MWGSVEIKAAVEKISWSSFIANTWKGFFS